MADCKTKTKRGGPSMPIEVKVMATSKGTRNILMPTAGKADFKLCQESNCCNRIPIKTRDNITTPQAKKLTPISNHSGNTTARSTNPKIKANSVGFFKTSLLIRPKEARGVNGTANVLLPTASSEKSVIISSRLSVSVGRGFSLC